MKTTDPRDRLDQKIDALLASQPIKASDDFVQRLQAEVEAELPRKKPVRTAPIIRFALPLAAALALACVVLVQLQQQDQAQGSEQPVATYTANGTIEGHLLMSASDGMIDYYEIQELLILEESLAAFALFDPDELNSSELLDSLDLIYSI